MMVTTPEPPRVLLDADTLVRAMTRSLLVMAGTARGSAFRPRWSLRIEAEADGHIGPGRVKVRQLRERFDWGERVLIEAPPPEAENDLEGTDPKDRHVLASAGLAGIRVVVTANVRHFGPDDLRRTGASAVHPDLFLSRVLTPPLYKDVVTAWSRSRTGSGTTPNALHSILGRHHPLTAEAMREAFPGSMPSPPVDGKPHREFRGDRCCVCGRSLNEESLALGVCPACQAV
ncbi:MAG: hypothetical protein LBK95_15360 [Bifidobacteriaceae bacterium]|jgi:hypothetical protein|nr:hypothetical protein [Bifidobacteriaceae bacterium]